MRVHVLSDDGGRHLHHTIHRLREAETVVAGLHEEYFDACKDLEQFRRTRPWWRRAFGVATAAEREASSRTQIVLDLVTDADLDRRQINDRARRQAAGILGEQALIDGLAELDDAWTMLRGYRDHHVLIGPTGLWAIEVRHRRIRLHVAGDQWWYEQLDARGRAGHSGWAADATGRTWGGQVTDVAAEITGRLSRHGHAVAVRTAVMLLHERAEVGRCDNPPVNLIGTRPAHLLWAIQRSATVLSTTRCHELVDLLHATHPGGQLRRP
ncbi:nuclease-related domain-containing protein [Actinoplanes sp. HUAS TT8]|uniref:nuclease-related domain-containing protein n=1 Tax=Actinoplanes sp. HUAS TT8 TaxID=3447453 RepID=UPI003F51BCA6